MKRLVTFAATVMFFALHSQAQQGTCSPSLKLFNGGNLSRPITLEAPHDQVIRIIQTVKPDPYSSDDRGPNQRLDIIDNTTNKTLLSGSLEKISGDKAAGDFFYVGFASICFSDFHGFVLAFQAGATGLNDLFIVFHSTPRGLKVSNVIHAWAGGIVIDPQAQTFLLYDMIDDPEDYKNPIYSCNFCPKHYNLISFATRGPKLVKSVRTISRQRLSPQDFVDHPLRYR